MSTDLHLLNNQILRAERELVTDRTDGHDYDDDSMAVLFTGNWQDPIPRRLIVAQELNPVDKIAWQAIRLTISNPAKPGSLPRREELAMMVNVTGPTVTCSKHMLRISRWMTFCKTVRKQGRFVGDIFLLNDEPLSLAATIELDSKYINYLETQAGSANKRLRSAAAIALQEIDQLTSVTTPTETEIFAQRIGSGSGMGIFASHQSKIFSAVGDAKPVNMSENPLNTGTKPDQSKNFAKVGNHQRKNLSPVGSKKYFSSPRSSSCFNNNLNINNSTRARGIEPENPAQQDEPACIDDFRDLADIGRWGHSDSTPRALLATVSPKLLSPTMEKYTGWLFAGKASTIAVIIRKLRPLPESVREMIIFQLVGREAANFHGWSEPVRNPVGYATELAKRAKRNEFIPDEWALELYRSADDGSEPAFEDSPEKLAIASKSAKQKVDV